MAGSWHESLNFEVFAAVLAFLHRHRAQAPVDRLRQRPRVDEAEHGVELTARQVLDAPLPPVREPAGYDDHRSVSGGVWGPGGPHSSFWGHDAARLRALLAANDSR